MKNKYFAVIFLSLCSFECKRVNGLTQIEEISYSVCRQRVEESSERVSSRISNKPSIFTQFHFMCTINK